MLVLARVFSLASSCNRCHRATNQTTQSYLAQRLVKSVTALKDEREISWSPISFKVYWQDRHCCFLLNTEGIKQAGSFEPVRLYDLQGKPPCKTHQSRKIWITLPLFFSYKIPSYQTNSRMFKGKIIFKRSFFSPICYFLPGITCRSKVVNKYWRFYCNQCNNSMPAQEIKNKLLNKKILRTARRFILWRVVLSFVFQHSWSTLMFHTTDMEADKIWSKVNSKIQSSTGDAWILGALKGGQQWNECSPHMHIWGEEVCSYD